MYMYIYIVSVPRTATSARSGFYWQEPLLLIPIFLYISTSIYLSIYRYIYIVSVPRTATSLRSGLY